MARFKVDHLEPTGTIRHTMAGIVLAPDVDPQPVVLVLKHAGKANARFDRALTNARAKGQTDSRSMVAIFARTVVVGWDHAYDEAGKAVAFSPEDCEALLLGLIDANREDAVAEAMTKAGDAARFTNGDDLGKG